MIGYYMFVFMLYVVLLVLVTWVTFTLTVPCYL